MGARRTLTFHEIVGQGGFGTVYRATLESGGGFRKEVAVKVIHDAGEEAAQIGERLRDEARLLGLVRHRALPSVDGLYWVSGRCALVTEYVRGESLLAATRRGAVPVGVAMEIGAEVASALHAAYTAPGPDGQELKLVHRDVKPANVQLTPAGEVKLLDFGIARAEFDEREAETSQVLLGSVSYMAPERLDLVSGPGNDVYALGVTLAECVTAVKMPRTSANRERHVAHVEQVLTRVRERIPDAQAFVSFLGELLAYTPEERPTAREADRRLRELRATAGPPFLREWAEETLRPDQRRPYDDRSGTLVGRQIEVSDEPMSVTATATEIRPRHVRRWLGAAAVLAGLAVASGALAVALGAFAVLSPRLAAPAPAPASVAPAPAPAPPAEAPPAPVVPPAPVAVMPKPARSPVEPAPAPEAPPVAPAPVAAASPVRAAAFADWLGSHADWSVARATAEGRADAGYLRGWVDGRPPAAATWAVDVSFAAAEAYCAGHGGLAPVDAAPATWSEAAGPLQEWRTALGKPAWRRYDGATSTAAKRGEANGFTGFRCAR